MVYARGAKIYRQVSRSVALRGHCPRHSVHWYTHHSVLHSQSALVRSAISLTIISKFWFLAENGMLGISGQREIRRKNDLSVPLACSINPALDFDPGRHTKQLK